MSVSKMFFEEHCQMVYRIDRDDMSSEVGLAGALDDLETALESLSTDFTEKQDDIYFFGFTFFDQGHPFGGEPDGTEDEIFTPWNEASKNFWQAVVQQPTLRPRITAIVDRVVAILVSAGEYQSVWEDDETQLGEPMVSLLALMDREFIPAYTKLLAVWDMDHEVEQLEAIEAIFDAHGVCEETEALLFCRVVTNPGQHSGDQLNDLFPKLQAHYGNFGKSALFRKIVTQLHALDAKYRADMAERGRAPADREFIYTNHAELKEATDALVAELNASA